MKKQPNNNNSPFDLLHPVQRNFVSKTPVLERVETKTTIRTLKKDISQSIVNLKIEDVLTPA